MIDFNALCLAPCIAAFGQSAVYRPGAGPAVPLTGVFNEFSKDEKLDGGGDMIVTTRPILGINLNDIPSGVYPCEGELVVVDGRVWQIVDPITDGLGGMKLHLMIASLP